MISVPSWRFMSAVHLAFQGGCNVMGLDKVDGIR